MSQQPKRPYSASLTTAAILLGHAIRMSLYRWQVSLIALLVFIVIAGPVYLTEIQLAPVGAARLLCQMLLMATGYVALIAALILVVYHESRADGASTDACRQRLTERWPGIRSEMVKTIALGAGLIGLIKFGLYAMSPPTVPSVSQNAPLIFYPVMGAALFAWIGHFRSCAHTPQLHLVARTTMTAVERGLMAKLAKRRYDNPVSMLLFVPILGALGAAYTLPLATPMLWLLTFWYLEVSLHELWLANPSPKAGKSD